MDNVWLYWVVVKVVHRKKFCKRYYYIKLIVQRVRGSRPLPEFCNSVPGGTVGDYRTQNILSYRRVTQ